MKLSKRELYIGIGVGAIVGVLALDSWVLTPLANAHSQLLTDVDRETKQRIADNRLVNREHPLNQQRWKSLTLGTLKQDQSQADSQILNNLSDWVQEAGLSVETLVTARVPQPVQRAGEREREKAFLKLTGRFVGSGSMAQLGRLIWRIQKSDIPVRITELSINSKKPDGTADELQIVLGVSTLFLAPEAARQVGNTSIGNTPVSTQPAGTVAAQTTQPTTRNEGRQ
jgi:hypothetical protein